WQYVFGKIISHEISSMRRSLFTVKVTSDTSDSQSIHESTFQKIKKRTKSISNKIVDDFENGMVNPGLQAGYALASLSCYQRNSDLVSQDLKHTSFYKSMVNAIQDISLSDHWLIRLGIVTEWCSFFETGLQELLPTRDGEATVKMLLEDLTKRLVEAKVPLTFQNVILSLTGYCLALRSLEVSSSQEHAGNTLRQILRIYSIDESLENQRQQVSSLLAHDEVQFAVIISMGYLSTLVMMDHKLVQQVIDTLVSKLTQGNQAY
ncbi:374_t:CDS:2, partial [Acaulospora morrowiae]